MNGKDYARIAALFKDKPIGTLANTSCGGFSRSMYENGYHCESLIDDFCDLFEAGNVAFNKKRFIEACGFEAWDELIMGMPIRKEKME